MKNIVLTVCFFFLCGNTFAENAPKADASDYWNFPAYESFAAAHAFQGLYPYSGDKQGAFKNDYVATLSDGSHWKVHPKNKTNVESWLPEDSILVHSRKSRYYFKREHNFELFNQRLNESVPAMLVKYPDHPLTVVESTSYVAHMNDRIPLTLNGKVFKTWNWVPYSKDAKPWLPIFRIKLLLSDGSSWWVETKCTCCLGKYKEGTPVYISSNKGRDNENLVFLISGLERESNAKSALLVDTNL